MGDCEGDSPVCVRYLTGCFGGRDFLEIGNAATLANRRIGLFSAPMCGKFTAMASWRRVVSFSRGFTPQGGEDECVIYRPMTMLPVIVWDTDTKQRRILPMRWGFPAMNNFLAPKHIHARS